jgi:uncharacterized protein (DUF433 family)
MANDEGTIDYPLLVRVDGILGGKLTLKGTRIPVWLVLQYLAAGNTFDEILADYPHVTLEHLQQVVAFSARNTLSGLPKADLPAEAV